METKGACGRDSPSRLLHALAHFVRRLIRERHGQNGRTRHMVCFDQVRDAMRDDARFAAAGSGQQQQRTFDMRHGFALLRVETCKEIHEFD